MQGAGSDRVLHATAAISLDFDGLTIRNGNASTGGGILTVATSLTLTDSTVSGNSGTGTGGIFALGGSVRLRATLLDTGGTGPTRTHALLPGSPAINFVAAGCAVATDRRGVARPQDSDQNGAAVCDSGAFELGTSAAAPPATTPRNDDDDDDDDEDDRKQGTEEQRRQRERTNRGNRDDVYTEGNVVEVHQDQLPPYVVIANRDGPVKVVLLCGDQCPTIRVGDYLEADGEKQHEWLFEATDVTVKRPGGGR